MIQAETALRNLADIQFNSFHLFNCTALLNWQLPLDDSEGS